MSDQHELAAGYWDSLSTSKRIGLILILCTLLAGAFGLGFTLGVQEGNNRVAAAEARHERAITELTKEQPKEQWTIGIRNDPADELPALEDAEISPLSLSEFNNLRNQNAARFEGETSISKPEFHKEYIGKRFTWTGYVVDVFKWGEDQLLVTIGEQIDGRALARLQFDRDDEDTLKTLKPGQRVTVTGVMSRLGDLENCKFEWDQ